jgi:AcrR family transcriptional regulator
MARRQLRADARRSYDRIVEAADLVIERDGGDASLEEIARTAGVGSATLHRHFASRWELLDAVFAERVEALHDEARQLAATGPGGHALVTWLRSLTRESARSHGMAMSMFADRPDDHEDDGSCHETIRRAGELVLRGAIADGSVRADVSLAHLLTLMSAIATSRAGGAAETVESDALVDLVLEGIFPRGAADGR